MSSFLDLSGLPCVRPRPNDPRKLIVVDMCLVFGVAVTALDATTMWDC